MLLLQADLTLGEGSLLSVSPRLPYQQNHNSVYSSNLLQTEIKTWKFLI